MNVRILLASLAWMIVLVSGCTGKRSTRFEILPADVTGISFENTLIPTDSFNVLQYVYFFNGGGVAIGDVNNDGLNDIFFSGNQVSSKLYLNKGNLTFEDITAKAGVSTDRWMTGVAMADVNNDGWLDIYACAAGHPDSTKRGNLLFINNGNLTFTESAKPYGLDDHGYSTQAAFFDYDKDGDNDLYLLRHYHQVRSLNDPKVKSTKGQAPSTDRLFRNNGDNTFTDVSMQAGITIEGYGLGVGIADVNRDGWPDVYVSNDFIFNDLLYINQRDGTFRNEIGRYIEAQSFNGMGNDLADINNDGLVDIVVADMLPEDHGRLKTMMMPYTYDKFKIGLAMGYEPQYMRNTLQLNNGNGTFSEIGQLSGVYNTDWSWGPLLADFDNDGNKDLFMANGYLKDMTDLDFVVYRKRNMMFKRGDAAEKALLSAIDQLWGAKLNNYIFKNNGDLTFTNHASDWGFTTSSFSNGAAYADLDNDGDLDIVTNNINDKAFVYKNNTYQKHGDDHYLQCRLHGPEMNARGYGTAVTLRVGEKVQFAEQSPFRGYQSTVDEVLHFGLGRDTVASIDVVWSDGKHQRLNDVKADQRLDVYYKDAVTPESKTTIASKPWFAKGKAPGLIYVHGEDDFEDFSFQPLLPHKFSQNGPQLAVDDIDGDGLEDLYIGGTKGHPGKLFQQKPGGAFKTVSIETDPMYEDEAALFFDADGDGDEDLYVVSGGCESAYPGKAYQDRIYKNDGHGKFTRDPAALPEEFESGSCVTAGDYDRDGDLDLFVGGSIVPGQYPQAPRSFILQNNGGRFKDVSASLYAPLSNLGLITTAMWADFDHDGWIDLVVAGEWMPVTLLKNAQGKLSDVTAASGLSAYTGWWNTLAAVDMDQDGDVDLVCGNHGLNSRFKASMNEPVTLYAKDFNQDHVVDPVMFTYVKGVLRAVATRDDLVDQIPYMRDRFTTYKKYGEASLQEIFTDAELKDAIKLTATYFATCYMENQGDGKFTVHALPIEAQFAPVNSIVADDFDGDGLTDLLLAGNDHAAHVLTGRYDASYGVLLKGTNDRRFAVVPNRESGLFIDGPVMDMKKIHMEKATLIVAGVNKDSLRVIQCLPQKNVAHAIALSGAGKRKD